MRWASELPDRDQYNVVCSPVCRTVHGLESVGLRAL